MNQRTHIVRSVRMVIDTTEERGRRIFANHLDQEVRTARVLLDEIRHIMDESGDEDQRSLQRLLLD